MCSLGSEQDDFESDSQDNLSNDNKTITGECCGKCGIRDDQMIRIHGRNVYCKPCFLIGTTHKFRAALGKHKAIKKNESVLVGHSGKANSTALVHLISAAMKEPLHKKLIFQPKFLYIDDGLVKGWTVEERLTAIQDISEQVENFGLTGFITSLSSCLRETVSMNSLYPMNKLDSTTIMNDIKDEDACLKKLFDELEDDTAKDELLRKMRRMQLLRIAHLLNCEKVFHADTSMDLAIKALADTSTGRGATISMDVAFLDDRSDEATVLRPMRDFTHDEVNWYLKLFTVPSILPTQSHKDRVFSSSVRSITQKFLDQLDMDFHGTAAAIYRTSNKLVPSKHKESQQTNNGSAIAHICVLCNNPIDSTVDAENCNKEIGQLSAMQATAFSKLTSSTQSESMSFPADNDEISCCGSSTKNCICNNGHSVLPADRLYDYLCYACKNIFRHSKSRTLNELSSFLAPVVRRSINREQMRADISSFLL